MKVAYFTGLRQIELRDEPAPRLARPNDVLVQMNQLGVCGSDVHYYTHGAIGNQVVRYPATLGHECAGTVVDVGPQVRRLRPGDRVAIDPALVCGQCDQCRAGRENTCRKLQFLGCPGEAPGAAAGLHVLPEENCFPLPANLSLEEGVLAEPLSIGLYAVRVSGLSAGGTTAIFGAGPIGLSVLLCAKATAPGRVYATDLLDPRLETARRCGADWAGNPRCEDLVAQVAQREPTGVDVAFECSGDPACIDQAMAMLRPGGRLMLVGIPEPVRVDFDIHVMRRKELTFTNVRRQRGCVGPVIDLMSQGRIDARPLLTHRFALPAIREAFELVAGYRDGVVKAVVALDE